MIVNEGDYEEFLAHYGTKGMHWGVRKDNHPGASNRVNHAARKDAAEFARAKMFTGEGAGNRRKLIKATVESKSKTDPTYKLAFDHHLANQNMASHASKAQRERKRKDVSAGVGKNVRAVNRAINGPFASGAAIAIGLSAYGGLKATGMDQKVMKAGKKFVANQAMKKEVSTLLKSL